MKTARQSDKVTWWAIGRSAVAKHGYEHAMEMAEDIITEGNRKLFKSGANGEPRPRLKTTVWTEAMDSELRELRGKGTAIYWCSVEMGLPYPVCVYRCRELGIADRRNRGRKTGETLAVQVP